VSTDEALVWLVLPRDGGLRMPLPDGKHPRVRFGMHLVFARTEDMRAAGLHGQRHVLDALLHGRGLIVCRARVTGPLQYSPREGRTIWGTDFHVLWVADASRVILRYMCDLAQHVIEALHRQGIEYDSRIWDALSTQRQRLDGQMDDDEYELYYDEANRAWPRRDPVYSWRSGFVLLTALWADIHNIKGLRLYLVTSLRAAMEVGSRQVPELGLSTHEMNAELERRFTDAFAFSEE